jgi:hypothetical protein
MDSFPDDFNRQVCNEKMQNSQAHLIKSVRKTFYDTITDLVGSCTQLITVEFPEQLWNEHRKTLIRELLERFGKLTIHTNSDTPMKKLIEKNINDIPNNVKKVTLDFIKND